MDAKESGTAMMLDAVFASQGGSSSDDICIACCELRSKGHAADCEFLEIAARYDAMLTMLRELEWSAGDQDADCPVCGNAKRDGHGVEEFGSLSGKPPVPCRLATLLRELG